MRGYIWKRLLLAIPLLIVTSFLTFAFINLSPLEPAEVVLHAQGVPTITEELIAQTRAEFGFDKPFVVRYGEWLLSCLQLNFGDSYVTGKPVWEMVGPAFLNTLKLTLVSSVFIIVASIGLGMLCAMQEGRSADKSVRGISFFLTAMPSYLLAAMLIWLFSVKLGILPTSGMDAASSYVLPVGVITINYAGIYFRIVRSSVLSNLNEDYVVYGRASGLPEARVISHVLRNSLQVAVSVFCMAFPIIMGSTVVVEYVFAWPGMGSLSVRSILGRDFPVIQAYVLLVAAAFVLFNTLSDMINAAMNPRLRREL
ncbi:ABC transporter permease [Paenibacillus sp. J5C_2022]|uniref:nickel/cobalt ABC transporter permease n=1 Tax=Paenibacillus sp. J5C2022 TaxID=2977129 RepID=UPI0021CE9085|nr:nickel/cobalt ABC transporter permease [Paenibacillus sp. J5C2022]MCU6711757.1 ABC transporter permease [Paenibacillus sp. J5C2022]